MIRKMLEVGVIWEEMFGMRITFQVVFEFWYKIDFNGC